MASSCSSFSIRAVSLAMSLMLKSLSRQDIFVCIADKRQEEKGDSHAPTGRAAYCDTDLCGRACRRRRVPPVAEGGGHAIHDRVLRRDTGAPGVRGLGDARLRSA